MKLPVYAAGLLGLGLTLVGCSRSGPETPASGGHQSQSEKTRLGSVEAGSPAESVATKYPFLSSEPISALRNALLTGNPEAIARSQEALTGFIKAHPQRIGDYVAVFRLEQDEWTLRHFAQALADSGVGLDNDQIILAAVELAGESSFQQRQHIMLHFLSKLPEMRDDVFQAVLQLTRQDPDAQVRASAVAVLADWTEAFPDQADQLIAQVGRILATAADEEVRGFAYQFLALHSDRLSADTLSVLRERLEQERDSFVCNLIVSALARAPEPVRGDALEHIRARFDREADPESQRNQLAQIATLGKADAIPLLQKLSTGESLLAQDAREYLAILSGGNVEANAFFLRKAERDAIARASNPARVEPHGADEEAILTPAPVNTNLPAASAPFPH